MSSERAFIPFGRPSYSEEEVAAASRIIRSGWVGLGPETEKFETELADFCGSGAAVLVNSCTSALTLSLRLHGIGPGDEVIVPSITWYATANAVLYVGATPVLADIDRETLNITAESVARCLSARTKAVIPVHMGGLPVDLASLRAALPAHITIIEDAAHAMGASYPTGERVGGSGNFVCFSFYANKNLSTGEGGLITLPDTEARNRLKSLRMHGLPHSAWNRYQNPTKLFYAQPQELGYKMSYMDLLASIGRIQLAKLPSMQEHRQKIARIYGEFITQEALPLTPQIHAAEDYHGRHLYVVKLDIERSAIGRDALILALRDAQVGAALHYLPMDLCPFYSPFRRTGLENAHWLGERILTLPISSSMSEEDAHYICAQLARLLK